VGAEDQRGSGGGGKRVNRESTCKQATRETNNVGAAGCSPPNEAGRQAGRQEAGVRQPGRQAGRLVYVPSLRAPFFVRARSGESGATHRVFDLSNRARRGSSGEPPDDCTCAESFERLRPPRRRWRRFENPPKFGSERDAVRHGAARRIRFGRFRWCREEERKKE